MRSHNIVEFVIYMNHHMHFCHVLENKNKRDHAISSYGLFTYENIIPLVLYFFLNMKII